MLTTIDTYRLRNKIPQNIVDETTACEVAKDIMRNDITYDGMSKLVKDCVKYFLIGGLLELCHTNDYNQRTLGMLFEWMRQKNRTESCEEAKEYLDMAAMIPDQDQNLARFYICDKLLKYKVFNEVVKTQS